MQAVQVEKLLHVEQIVEQLTQLLDELYVPGGHPEMQVLL